MKKIYLILSVLFIGSCCNKPSDEKFQKESNFPYKVTESTFNKKNLSSAIKRSFNDYMAYRPEDNPLYTNFKYSKFKGFEYNDGDGTVSRRDPSKIIKVNNKYYVWYTKRQTKCPPIGADKASQCDDSIPSTDWDLSEIWYATSNDGFEWKERGVAVKRPEKPNVGYRSVSTPDILVWKNKYYLYYQSFSEPSGLKGDYCPVSMSYSDSPDGPWTHLNKEIIPNGEKGEWDQFAIHDPYPLVHNNKIYIYYKSSFNRPDKLWIAQGLAMSDSPEGPFVKHPLNPLLNSGHETILFPFKEGVASIQVQDGMEHNTIQYAKDWVNFEIASVVYLPPIAAGPFIPDAFRDTGNGKGIEWGACHFTAIGEPGKKYSILARFDCNLLSDEINTAFKDTRNFLLPPQVYFSKGLSKEMKKERKEKYLLE